MKEEAIITYQLRLPLSLVKQIDELCLRRKPHYYSRHSWVLAAILNKLSKEQQD